MAGYRDASIKRKLTFVILCTCVLGLSLACMAFEIYERTSFRKSMVSRLAEDADSLSLATAASLAFDDTKFAEQMLGTIRSERYVMFAVLYDNSGKIFAEYRRNGLDAKFMTPEWREEGTTFEKESLTLHRNISVDGAKTGSIAVVSDLSELQSKMKQYRWLSHLCLVDLDSDDVLDLFAFGGLNHAAHSAPGGDRRQGFRAEKLCIARLVQWAGRSRQVSGCVQPNAWRNSGARRGIAGRERSIGTARPRAHGRTAKGSARARTRAASCKASPTT